MRRYIFALLPMLLAGCLIGESGDDANLLEPGDSEPPLDTPTTQSDATEIADQQTSTVQSGNFGTDTFQTTNLAPEAPRGAQWTSASWANGQPRTLGVNDVDPYDSMLEMRGYGTLRIQGDGTARVSGRAPRLYIQRPNQVAIWENVEVTYYAKLHALTDDAPSHAGFKIGARSWHGVRPFDECDGKTYYGIARFDGHATSTKELLHGESYGSRRGTDIDIPNGEWVGVKFVVRNTDGGGVRLQTYLDHTNGRAGGEWNLVAEHVDDGNWATKNPPTGCSYSDKHVIRGKAPAVFARFDGVERIDIRDFSVREVEPEFDQELFADVPADSIFATPIAWAKATGLTKGCNPPENTRFCPKAPVTRAQMASFLSRFYELPRASEDYFVDDDGLIHEANINAIARRNITRGCNPPENTRFCPDNELTRGQIAAFLDRAGSLPDTDRDFFVDDDDSLFEASINRLAASGITSGCGDDSFCPDEPVTREQMVTFLYRARNL